MRRRDFFMGSVAVGSGLTFCGKLSPIHADSSQSCSVPFPPTPGLTKYIVEFVRSTQYPDISGDVIELGKKSLLDGIGLALAGSRLPTYNILKTYLGSFGFPAADATVVGTRSKLPSRFAALVIGVA